MLMLTGILACSGRARTYSPLRGTAEAVLGPTAVRMPARTSVRMKLLPASPAWCLTLRPECGTDGLGTRSVVSGVCAACGCIHTAPGSFLRGACAACGCIRAGPTFWGPLVRSSNSQTQKDDFGRGLARRSSVARTCAGPIPMGRRPTANLAVCPCWSEAGCCPAPIECGRKRIPLGG